MVQAARVVFDSDASRNYWEQWTLIERKWLGLHLLSPNGTYSERLDTFRTVHIGLQSWVPPIPLNKCNRKDPSWPFAQHRARFRAALGATDDDYVVLYIGTLSPSKGVAELVVAWAEHAIMLEEQGGTVGNMHLVIAGSGSYSQEALQSVAANVMQSGETRAKLHVINDLQGPREKIGYYAAADVHVMNSECENFGQVTAEAMAFSLPSLGTSCGGTSEIIVHNVTGLLHSFEQVYTPQLAKNLAALDMRFPERRLLAWQFGEAGCHRAHTVFAANRVHAEFESVVLQVARDMETAMDATIEDIDTELQPFAEAVRGPHSAYAGKAEVHVLEWEMEELEPYPVAWMEGSTWVEGNRMYIQGGYINDNAGVYRVGRAFDMETRQWITLGEDPLNFPSTHVTNIPLPSGGVLLVSGQIGPACSPGGSRTFYHLNTTSWAFQRFGPLPEQRHGHAACIFDDRLHVFGGTLPDRVTIARGHWSVGVDVQTGQPGSEWRQEPPVPMAGGSHGIPVVLTPRTTGRPRMYVWGFVDGEYRPRNPGTGDISCIPNLELPGMAMLTYSPAEGWRRIQDSPTPLAHNVGCLFHMGQDSIITFGGQYYDRWLSNAVWMFNATEELWTYLGKLPVYGKASSCGIWKDHLYYAGGQIGDKDGQDSAYGPMTGRTWAVKLPAFVQERLAARDALSDYDIHLR